MNQNLKMGLIFTVGVAIGSTITYFSLKEKFELQKQEEIDSVIEVFTEEREKEKANAKKEVKEAKETKEKPDLFEYYKNRDLSSMYKSSEPNVKDKFIFVISPQELGSREDDGYVICSYRYFKDGILVDKNNNIIPDDEIEATIGLDFKDSFGEFEDDAVHIRNEVLKKDFEIIYDPRHYYDLE